MQKIYKVITHVPGTNCWKQPLNVDENASFLIDNFTLKCATDCLYDDNGSYKNQETRYLLLTTTNKNWECSFLKSEVQKLNLTNYNILWCTYWVHKSYTDFKRKMYQVETCKPPKGIYQNVCVFFC